MAFQWLLCGLSMAFQWPFSGLSVAFQWPFSGLLASRGWSFSHNCHPHDLKIQVSLFKLKIQFYQVEIDENGVDDRPEGESVFFDSGDAEDDDQQGPAQHSNSAVAPLFDVFKKN